MDANQLAGHATEVKHRTPAGRTGPERRDQLLDLATAVVEISRLLRISREMQYSAAVEEKRFPEKATLALWYLGTKQRLSARALSRFLRLSSQRTRDALKPLTQRGLVAVSRDLAEYSLTEAGRQELREQFADDAARYRALFHGTGFKDEDLRGAVAVAETVRDGAEAWIRAMVLGDPAS